MKKEKYYAVITGDLVAYSLHPSDVREIYVQSLKNTLQEIQNYFSRKYQIFRGDSFQCSLKNPKDALKVALLIRANLLTLPKSEKIRSFFRQSVARRPGVGFDARIAIGIGTVSQFKSKIGESDGEAFRFSGQELDKLKSERKNLVIKTPWPEVNSELEVECAFLDSIIHKWSAEQAEAMFYLINDYKQDKIAEILHVSQPSISYRLNRGGSWAIQKFIDRYEEIIKEKIKINELGESVDES